jgi:hypothetical protein
MTATHDLLIQIQTILAPPPVQQQGFTTPLFISSDSEFNPGEVVRFYTSVEDVNLDNDLSADTVVALETAFAQNPQPAAIMVTCQPEGLTTYTATQALDRVRNAGYFVTAVAWQDHSTPADQLAFAQDCAAREVLYVFQSADAGWITPGLPTGFAGIDNIEYVAGVYATPAEPYFLDLAWLTKNMVYDPDRTSRNWAGQVRGLTPYSVTSTAYTNLIANQINFAAPFGPAPMYVAPGVSTTGRPVSELISVQWFKKRIRERWSALFLKYDAEGAKIPVDSDGQELLAAEARTQFALGVTAGHFTEGQLIITLPVITQQDRDAQRIPIEISLMTLTGAVRITSTITFSREPIVSTEA